MQDIKNTPINWFRFITQAILDLYEKHEAESIAALVLEEITGIHRLQLPVHQHKELPGNQQQQLANTVDELKKGRPVQYALKHSWFYGLAFYVDERVLIPRPETEELVHWIIQESQQQIKILDIGTGSGCIAISLAKNLQNAEVHALDNSKDALSVALHNAQKQNAFIRFHYGDILNPATCHALPMFDTIVSNPPYVTQNEKKKMEPHVLEHEPHAALFVNSGNPLQFYRAIAGFAKKHLNPGGTVFVEINKEYGNEVCSLFKKEGFTQCQLKHDINERARIIKTRYK